MKKEPSNEEVENFRAKMAAIGGNIDIPINSIDAEKQRNSYSRFSENLQMKGMISNSSILYEAEQSIYLKNITLEYNDYKIFREIVSESSKVMLEGNGDMSIIDKVNGFNWRMAFIGKSVVIPITLKYALKYIDTIIDSFIKGEILDVIRKERTDYILKVVLGDDDYKMFCHIVLSGKDYGDVQRNPLNRNCYDSLYEIVHSKTDPPKIEKVNIIQELRNTIGLAVGGTMAKRNALVKFAKENWKTLVKEYPHYFIEKRQYTKSFIQKTISKTVFQKTIVLKYVETANIYELRGLVEDMPSNEIVEERVEYIDLCDVTEDYSLDI